MGVNFEGVEHGVPIVLSIIVGTLKLDANVSRFKCEAPYHESQQKGVLNIISKKNEKDDISGH